MVFCSVPFFNTHFTSKCVSQESICIRYQHALIIKTNIMADVNARREARRRRILENSGNRLRKITGRNDPDEIKGKYNEYLNTHVESIAVRCIKVMLYVFT